MARARGVLTDGTTHPEISPLMRPTYQVTELLGDGIGPELSRAVHRLAEALPIRLEFVEVDFRLENRRARGKAVYDEAVETITPPGSRSSIRRRPPRRAPTRSSAGGSTSRSFTGRSTPFPACRPISAASSTSTSCGSPPEGPTTIPAG